MVFVPYTSYVVVVRHGEDGPHRELRAMFKRKVRWDGHRYLLFDSGSMLHLVRKSDVIEAKEDKPLWNLT